MTHTNAHRGRPATPADELLDRIHNAAIQLLQQRGHEAFGINHIATQANIAKKTIYRFYRDKNALLDAIILHWSATQTLPQITIPQPEQTPQALLETFFIELADKVLSPLSIGIFKYVQVTNNDNRPLRDQYCELGIFSMEKVLNAWFHQLREQGKLAPSCPPQPARYLQGLIIAPMLRNVTLGLWLPAPAENITGYVKESLNFVAPLLFKLPL